MQPFELRFTDGCIGAGNIIKNVQTGEKNVGKIIKAGLDEWLKSFALQETYKGIAATAEAIGLTFLNPPGAASKWIEAGTHFGVAALAGGASAAIPNQSLGGSTTQGTPETTTAQNSQGSSTDSGSSGPQTITINIQGQSLLTEGQVGREVQNALDMYHLQYR